MITISNCQKCDLYLNQKPRIDKTFTNSNIIFLGLSGKLDCEPLDPKTNSGKIIKEIEGTENYYKTNLVKCVPLDKNKKIRYPNKKEISSCFENFLKEVEFLKPKIVFLLGSKVADFFKDVKIENVKFIKIYHPSYISVYKRKEKDKYIEEVREMIDDIH